MLKMTVKCRNWSKTVERKYKFKVVICGQICYIMEEETGLQMWAVKKSYKEMFEL